MPPAPDDPILRATLALLEARWLEGLQAPAPDKLADLQSHGALVLGDWVPFASRDWSRQRCTVHIGARETVERTGTHPLGDPVRGLPEWARHACADGSVLRAGTVVTTGSWVGMLEAAVGGRIGGGQWAPASWTHRGDPGAVRGLRSRSAVTNRHAASMAHR